ncbi:MAG: hypothetical protein GWN58_48945, partial [Anaerolineae bacterium]|nr:hypothetical protein [Anaerolineae bacterium]
MPAKKRRTPDLDPSVAAALAAKPAHAPKKPKRARASYDMKPETIQAIKDIA